MTLEKDKIYSLLLHFTYYVMVGVILLLVVTFHILCHGWGNSTALSTSKDLSGRLPNLWIQEFIGVSSASFYSSPLADC